jgi:hypothetical protein
MTFLKLSMLNCSFGAGATLRYGPGSSYTKMMQLRLCISAEKNVTYFTTGHFKLLPTLYSNHFKLLKGHFHGISV